MLVWDAWLDFYVPRQPGDYSDEELPTFVAFDYESQVNNGGHVQYFVNRADRDHRATVECLNRIGATGHARNLMAALDLTSPGERPKSAAEFLAGSSEGIYAAQDEWLWSANPSVMHYIVQYALEHRGAFFHWVD